MQTTSTAVSCQAFLKRPVQPGNTEGRPEMTTRDRGLQERHRGLEQPMDLEELERYLGKVKKGTAPGTAGASMKFRAAATRELKEDMVSFYECLL